MAPSAYSQSNALRVAASVFGTFFLGFGVNAIVNPEHALTFFEFVPPTAAADKSLVDSLMAIYGVRDIFMGLAIYATAYFGDRKALGAILLCGSGVAFADGFICKASVGKGEWNHWGYAPMLTAIGMILLGIFDRT
ncbi:MAG: hypothetical protein M1814_002048 [Vezdaea aestivalis]|nr:MAG: hypothetical protein M1814_002048 [Vezdaea aestivalis]